MATTIRRFNVYRYDKSGKLAAISSRGYHAGFVVLELTLDMSTITAVRFPTYIKRDMTSPTRYVVEVREEISPAEGNKSWFSYDLIRVLAPEDLDLARWSPAASLSDLPVSPESEPTEEELFWAGKRPGNIDGGILLSCFTAAMTALVLLTYPQDPDGAWVCAFIGVVAGLFLIRYPWKKAIPPIPAKLDELQVYKETLRQRRKSEYISSKTRFEAALEDFGTWKDLSAELFEFAISLRLEKEGFTVQQTRFSGDGGVDIEATDKLGKPMIVQAKKYSANVGVNVVREMVGVRESRDGKPRTMIYSLSGFTRGAKELAKQHNIELRDIRSELLKV